MLDVIVVDIISLLVRATGTLIIRGLTFGRVRTAPLFSDPNDQTPLIGTQTWEGFWVAGRWTLFVVGLLFWIVFAFAVVVARLS